MVQFQFFALFRTLFCALPVVLSVGFFMCLFSVGVVANNFAGDVAAGKVKAEDERCAECHGMDGNIHAVNESAKIPKLAGQSPHYLLKQFQDFRSGVRENDFMGMMARNLDDAEVVDILAWYASQPAMTGSENTNPHNEKLFVEGEKLFLEGDARRGILACALCHGRDGRGTSEPLTAYPGLKPELIPVIAGQDWHYLNQQMHDWRAGTRANSQDGLMNQVAEKLTDTEINALSDFISVMK